jgi:hypothetical protein
LCAERSLDLRRNCGCRLVCGELLAGECLEIPGEQFVDAGDRLVGDAREHLAEKRFGIAPVEFGAAEQAVECRGALTADIATREEEVLAP